jgi:hypothetical protein
MCTGLFLNKYRAVFLLGLLFSVDATASQKDFVLITPDETTIGHGSYEEAPYAKIQMAVSVDGLNYTGTGTLEKSLPAYSKGMYSNRSRPVTKIKKFSALELASHDGKKISCEINARYNDVWGQCIDPATQAMMRIKLIAE